MATRKPKLEPEVLGDNRAEVIKALADEVEQCLHDRQAVVEALREIKARAKQEDLSKVEVAALMKLARFRWADKMGVLAEELGALERIGEALGIDLT